MLLLFQNVWRLLKHPDVRFTTKATFVLAVLIYGFSPDLMPFMPFDDIVVIWLASRLFVRVGNREAGLVEDNVFDLFRNRQRDKDVIDADGEFVDEK